MTTPSNANPSATCPPAPPASRARPKPVDWSQVKRVHLMGICGSAMGALALMLEKRGFEVRGSDTAPYPPMSDRLAEAGIAVFSGYDAANLDWGPDAAVIGNVIRPDNPEVLRLRALDLPATSMAEALADVFFESSVPVVVSGTHGKTTTSSMTAWILHEAGLHPSFFIGGLVAPWHENHWLAAPPPGHTTTTPFIVEGDEYDTAFFDKDSKFHHYRPKLAAINNIEFDHADIFADLDAIIATFARFARRVPADGVLVVPIADTNVRRALDVAAPLVAPVLFTALSGHDAEAAKAHVQAFNIAMTTTGSNFDLQLPDSSQVPVELHVPGLHNIRNALTAAALAHRFGAPVTAIAKALGTFALPWRRLTLKHTVAGVPIIDDFAHHPTAIAATIAALRTIHPGRRIVALFEVQSNTARRRVFQDDFATALATADRVFFCRPLAKGSDPLPPEARLDLPALAAAISGKGTTATIIEDIEALALAVANETTADSDVIVAMSGRHFDDIHGRVARHLEARFGVVRSATP